MDKKNAYNIDYNLSVLIIMLIRSDTNHDSIKIYLINSRRIHDQFFSYQIVTAIRSLEVHILKHVLHR